MSKKVNETLGTLPKSETITLTFNNSHNTYIVTRDRDNAYYLYEKSNKGYIFKKSRKKDPCFPECY